MKEYKCWYGLGGGFGGARDFEIEEFDNEEKAEEYAWELACEYYEHYVGLYGLRDYEQIAKDEIPNADLQLLANVNNLILELKSGKVDAIVMEKPVAEMAVKTNPELAVGKPTYEEESGGNAVGVAKGNEDLLAKVNEVIKELNETGKMDEYILKANELAASANIVE